MANIKSSFVLKLNGQTVEVNSLSQADIEKIKKLQTDKLEVRFLEDKPTDIGQIEKGIIYLYTSKEENQ